MEETVILIDDQESLTFASFASFELPTEVWRLILLAVSPKSLAKIVLACKKWKELVQSTTFLVERRRDLEKYLGVVLLGEPRKDWIATPEAWRMRADQSQDLELVLISTANDEGLIEELQTFMKSRWFATSEPLASILHQSPRMQRTRLFFKGLFFTMNLMSHFQLPDLDTCRSYLFFYREGGPEIKDVEWKVPDGFVFNAQTLCDEGRDMDPMIFYLGDYNEADDTLIVDVYRGEEKEQDPDGSAPICSGGVPKVTLPWFDTSTDEISCSKKADRAFLEYLVDRRFNNGLLSVTNEQVLTNYTHRRRQLQNGEKTWWVELFIAFFVALFCSPIWSVYFFGIMMYEEYHRKQPMFQKCFILFVASLMTPVALLAGCLFGFYILLKKTYGLGVPDVFYYFIDPARIQRFG